MKKCFLIIVFIAAWQQLQAQNTYPFPSSGSVGIGTSNPISLFHVFTNTDMYGITTGDGSNSNLRISGTASGALGYSLLQTFTAGNSAGGILSLQRDGGKVGIGTSTPSGLLHIKNLNGPDYIQITKSSSSADLDIYANYDGSDDSQTGSFAYGVRPYSKAWQIWERHSTANWNNIFTVQINGNVGIGTANPDAKLAVNGTVHAKEVKVDLSIPVPDYVFKPTYQLSSLKKVKDYINKNHHLPEMPSAAQIEKGGLNLGEMNTKLLKKVEELTLYLIEKDKEVKAANHRIDRLSKRLDGFTKK